MCKCTPEIRTPFCGRGDCLPPGYANLGEWLGIFSDAEAEAAAQASLDRVWEQAVRHDTDDVVDHRLQTPRRHSTRNPLGR